MSKWVHVFSTEKWVTFFIDFLARAQKALHENLAGEQSEQTTSCTRIIGLVRICSQAPDRDGRFFGAPRIVIELAMSALEHYQRQSDIFFRWL